MKVICDLIFQMTEDLFNSNTYILRKLLSFQLALGICFAYSNIFYGGTSDV